MASVLRHAVPRPPRTPTRRTSRVPDGPSGAIRTGRCCGVAESATRMVLLGVAWRTGLSASRARMNVVQDTPTPPPDAGTPFRVSVPRSGVEAARRHVEQAGSGRLRRGQAHRGTGPRQVVPNAEAKAHRTLAVGLGDSGASKRTTGISAYGVRAMNRRFLDAVRKNRALNGSHVLQQVPELKRRNKDRKEVGRVLERK